MIWDALSVQNLDFQEMWNQVCTCTHACNIGDEFQQIFSQNKSTSEIPIFISILDLRKCWGVSACLYPCRHMSIINNKTRSDYDIMDYNNKLLSILISEHHGLLPVTSLYFYSPHIITNNIKWTYPNIIYSKIKAIPESMRSGESNELHQSNHWTETIYRKKRKSKK